MKTSLTLSLPQLIEDALDQRLELADVQVQGIAQDHRQVKSGFVFVARRGALVDGHRFAKLAVERGAVAVIGEQQGIDTLPWRRVPYIFVESDKIALAKLAASFYGRPSDKLMTFGVTGTDGKTTTSFLLHYLLSERYKTGLLSTAGNLVGEEALELFGHFTTPEATEVQQSLASFVEAECSHAVVESSSHGFALHRLDTISYDLGLWTNLSPEHLDFHKTFEAYREAKLSLMRRAAVSILNRDDPSFEVFRDAAKAVISYGTHPESNWQALDIEAHPDGQSFRLRLELEGLRLEQQVKLPMLGRYNVYNALAALAAAHYSGIELTKLLKRLETFPGVPGRMQLVQSAPFSVVVDFAHSPPALKQLLETLRTQTTGRLIVVIGAAGERDPGKRAPLGEVAETHADLSIFTEEDVRSEDLNQILGQMAAGALRVGGKATETYWCIADRREAIHFALSQAEAGDTVVLAGKGHERTLERQHETLPWDEVQEVERALKALEKSHD